MAKKIDSTIKKSLKRTKQSVFQDIKEARVNTKILELAKKLEGKEVAE